MISQKYSLQKISKSENLRKILEEETSILNDVEDITIAHRYHFQKSGITQIPKCKSCGNIVKADKEYSKKIFSQYCSGTCNSKSSSISQEALKLLQSYDWMYEQRISNRLSIEKIAEILGVSTTPVKKYLDIHNISVKYKWTDSKNITKTIEDRINSTQISIYGEDIYDKISSYDWMSEQYNTLGKSCMQISEELGIGNECVRIQMKKLRVVDEFIRTYHITTSQGELELYNFIKKICPDAIQNYRLKYNEKELDIYIPSLGLGIEYNGCYYHGTYRPKTYHTDKLNYWNSLGIRLIQIWDDDWNFNRSSIEIMLMNKLGKQKKIYHARKCYVKDISHQEFANFLIENHTLKATNAKIRLGLFTSDDILVSVMGFKTIPINHKDKSGWELNRFSTKPVNGAFGKLFKYFLSNYSGDVYSLADLELVDRNNNVYLSNGFAYYNSIPPDYRYYNPSTKQREHKFLWRLKKFKSLGYDVDKHSERELADMHGLIRCYDSGKVWYVYRR